MVFPFPRWLLELNQKHAHHNRAHAAVRRREARLFRNHTGIKAQSM
jgi:hypothetical protein